jgi:hypothetical protein
MTSGYQRVSAAHFTWNAAGTGCFPLLTHLGRTFPLYFNSHPRCHARTYHQLPSKPHTQFSLRHPTPQLCPKSDTEGHHDGYYNVANYRSALTLYTSAPLRKNTGNALLPVLPFSVDSSHNPRVTAKVLPHKREPLVTGRQIPHRRQ